MAMDDQEKLQKFKNDFLTDYAVYEEQRDQANAELRFCTVTGGQWEGWLETHYQDRSKIELDQVSDYLYRTYGQWVENRLSVNYEPDDDATSDEDAELLDGLFRRDMRKDNGYLAVDSAVFESMACGIGAWHLSTRYADEEDPEDDSQDIFVEQINNAYSMVAFGPARRVDKADATRCTILFPYTRQAFEEKWPDAQVVSAAAPDDRSWFNWSNRNLVYVACRYDVRVTNVTMHTWAHPVTGEIERLTDKELEDDRAELVNAGFQEIKVKRIRQRQVFKTLFCGGDILEPEKRIAGKYIPVIPVYAYRSFVDGVEYYHGVIRKRMDSQRLLNMSASLLAEEAAYNHEPKPLVAPEQVQGLESHWAADRHNKPYLPIHPLRNDDGEIQVPGILGTLEGARLGQAAQSLIEITSNFIQQGTGGAPQDTLDTDASGKAINAVLKRVDLNTRPVFDNISAAMKHFGEVYRCMAAEVYRDNRSMKLPNEKGDVRGVRLMEMRASPDGITYGNDPARGKFNVVVDTGPSYETQREETIVALKDIAQALGPQHPLTSIVISQIIQLLPQQGMSDIKEYVRKQLLVQGAVKPETEEEMAMVQAAMQPKEDAQAQWLKAAAIEQQTQAARNAKELQKIDSEIQENLADTAKTIMETRLMPQQVVTRQ